VPDVEYIGRSDGSAPVTNVISSPVEVPQELKAINCASYVVEGTRPRTGTSTESPVGCNAGVALSIVAVAPNRTTALSACCTLAVTSTLKAFVAFCVMVGCAMSGLAHGAESRRSSTADAHALAATAAVTSATIAALRTPDWRTVRSGRDGRDR
jgi:hypothetical protein